MDDVSAIREVVRRARRRIRLQAALEGATTAMILATTAALVIVFLLRTESVSSTAGIGMLVAAVSIVLLGGLVGFLRRDPDAAVARRVDRASDLSDRLSTAIEFDRRLRDGSPADDEFLRAAIRDGVRAVARANVVAATPYRMPRDARAALGFLLVSALVAGIAIPASVDLATLPSAPNSDVERAADGSAASWELDYPQSVVDEIRKIARRDHDPQLERLADELDQALRQLEANEIDKEEMLGKMTKATGQLDESRLTSRAKALLGDARDAIRRAKPKQIALAPPPPPPTPPPTPPHGNPGNPGAPKPSVAGDKPDRGPRPGEGRGDLLGNPTPKTQPTRELDLPGNPTDSGTSTRSTINTAAKRGTATRGYAKVYQEYTKQVEEVLESEKVPSGYRYYIKKYFRQIRPEK